MLRTIVRRNEVNHEYNPNKADDAGKDSGYFDNPKPD